MEHQATIQEVVQSLASTAAVISATCVPATYGLIEAIKKIIPSTRFIGLISIVVGFFFSILIERLFLGTFWGTLNITIAIVVACGTPGIYSALKATKATE